MDEPGARRFDKISCILPQDSLGEQDHSNTSELSCAEIRAILVPGKDSIRIEALRECAAEDEEYQQLLKIILEGFPKHRGNLPELCRRYWCVRQHLSVDDDLIVFGCRLLIPASMRREVLQKLHESHQGSVRTKQRARLVVWCTGLALIMTSIMSFSPVNNAKIYFQLIPKSQSS